MAEKKSKRKKLTATWKGNRFSRNKKNGFETRVLGDSKAPADDRREAKHH